MNNSARGRCRFWPHFSARINRSVDASMNAVADDRAKLAPTCVNKGVIDQRAMV